MQLFAVFGNGRLRQHHVSRERFVYGRDHRRPRRASSITYDPNITAPDADQRADLPVRRRSNAHLRL